MEPREIREARLKMGWTQIKLAKTLGVSTKSVYRWETGWVRPSLLSEYKLRILEKTLEIDNE